MMPDIVLTHEQRQEIAAFLRKSAQNAARAAETFYRWSAQVEIEAEQLRLGIKPEDGRQASGFGLRAIQRAASTKSTWGNPIAGIIARELLMRLDPKVFERAEERRHEREVKKKKDSGRLAVWRTLTEYIDEQGLEAGVDLLNELRDDMERQQGRQRGMRLVLMPANVVPIGRRGA